MHDGKTMHALSWLHKLADQSRPRPTAEAVTNSFSCPTAMIQIRGLLPFPSTQLNTSHPPNTSQFPASQASRNVNERRKEVYVHHLCADRKPSAALGREQAAANRRTVRGTVRNSGPAFALTPCIRCVSASPHRRIRRPALRQAQRITAECGARVRSLIPRP